MRIFKILKNEEPKGLSRQLTISNRNNIIILPKSQNFNAFLLEASKIWNTIISQISIKNTPLFMITPSFFKNTLKSHILQIPSCNNPNEWDEQNFEVKLRN